MKKVIVMIIILAVIASGIFYFINKKNEPLGQERISYKNGTAVINFSVNSQGKYLPNEIRVKQGTKIKIVADIQKIVIPIDMILIDGYDIRKAIIPEDDLVEFTADKKGKFRIHSGNGKASGWLIVE